MPFSFRRNQRPYTMSATLPKSEEIPITSVDVLPSSGNVSLPNSLPTRMKLGPDLTVLPLLNIMSPPSRNGGAYLIVKALGRTRRQITANSGMGDWQWYSSRRRS